MLGCINVLKCTFIVPTAFEYERVRLGTRFEEGHEEEKRGSMIILHLH